MKQFIYSFKSKNGHISTGKIKASNITQAKTFLKGRHIFPIRIKENKKPILKQIFRERSVKDDDIVIFTQLFSSCIQTGLSVKDSISLMARQSSSDILRSRLEEILLDVEGGSTLSAAFARHLDIFPIFYPMLLKAGESSGDLTTILDYLGGYLERINSIKKELVGVFTYPAIISVIGIILMGLILVFVAPTFREVFSQVNLVLPIPTIVLFFISDMLTSYYPLFLLLLVATASALFFFYRSYQGKKTLHHLLLQLPFLGRIIKDLALLRFLRTFEILANNKVPILETLKVLEEGTSNYYLKDIVKDMRKEVSRGLSLSTPLLDHPEVIPPMISHSLSASEKSGNLGITLTRLSHFLDREITFTTKMISSRLDPLLTFFLGMMVLFIALAIYLPIFDMMGAVR